MNMLQQMAAKAREFGHIPGQSAKQWRDRDPKAAASYAEWIKANMAPLTKAIAEKVMA